MKQILGCDKIRIQRITVQAGENMYSAEQYEREHQKDLDRIRRFRLLDDDFMSKCFEDNIECTELVLNIVLNRTDLKVETVRTQYTIKNLQGKSVRLDVFARDSSGKAYNIEVQRSYKGADAKRSRYNSSMIDVNTLRAGDDYSQLPETYVIFITENDVMGKGMPVYHIKRVVEETGETFGDGSHIIYVNAQYRDGSPLGNLMHDFSCNDPDEMKYRILADRARYFKEDKEGILVMCKAMEDMRNETIKETSMASAKRMLEDGFLSLEKIAEYTGLSLEEVRELSEKN